MSPKLDPGRLNPVAVYVHTPFCPTKCGYCDFNSFAMEGEIIERTVQAIRAEISRSSAAGRPAKTVFFGGGTPTLIPAEQLGSILESVRDIHPFDDDVEVTVESNPGTVDSANYPALREAGFNRISIGAQSFSAFDLKRLGRVHSPEQVPRAIHEARKAGFENINLDLMFGLPHQTVEAWRKNLQSALALDPQHLSLYALTIEPNTRFHRLYHKGLMSLPSDELFVEMLDIAIDTAESKGYRRYEVSNFAKPGYECKHNLAYWRAEEYAGYGPGAVGCLQDGGSGTRTRYTNVKHPVAYCESFLDQELSTKWCESESLDDDNLRTERIMLGLRLIDGVDPERLAVSDRSVDELIRNEWGEIEGGRLRLTRKGLLFHNDAVLMLL